MQSKLYKQIVVLSGKGGTGKTTLSSAFASLINKKIIIDCDVDAANLHLVLKPKVFNSIDFYGCKKAFIEKDKCDECGLCKTVCRFEAIENYSVNQISCEGCGFCFRICPSNAIKFEPSKAGCYYECTLPDNSKFYYAKLLPGQGNSGKLVSQLKKRALANVPNEIEWVIVDGPPGIGCPVNASISGADYALLVTEPTQSGMHDFKRLVELLKTFKVNAGIVINKYDLNQEISAQIFRYADSQNIPIIGSIPFDEQFVKSLINGDNIVDVNNVIRNEFEIILKQLQLQVEFLVK